MTCPICDQKPMNCDCTATEKRQWSEIEDLRLTDKERLAIQWVVGDALSVDGVSIQATLRGLLERHFPTPENQSSQDNAPETHTNPDEGSVQDSNT